MIDLVTLEYAGTSRDLAAKVRPALAQRSVVRITGFSRALNDLVALAQQLGTTTYGTNPVVDTNQSRTELVALRSPTPTVVLEFCVEPMQMIRWYSDLTEVYPRYASLLTGLDTADAVYADGTTGPLIRKSRLNSKLYAAITSDLVSVTGADEARVQELIRAGANRYGVGIRDLIMDQKYDLLVHLSDGIAAGQMHYANPDDPEALLRASSQQGSWLRLAVDPDWDLMRPA